MPILQHPAVIIADRAHVPEKIYYADVHVCDSRGNIVLRLGDTQQSVFPRSAIKLLQALDTVESGAADSLGLSESEMALACASHGGELAHIATTRSILAKAGLRPNHLLCGSHPPTNRESQRRLITEGNVATALHHNCSGKHAFGLAWCTFHKASITDYINENHPLQQRSRENLERFSGHSIQAVAALDGCSYPTWARPLSHWALAMARIADPAQFGASTQRSVQQLLAAVQQHPNMVSGEGTFVSLFTRYYGTRAYIKNGADGVMCAAIPDTGLGVAIKVRSGQKRAASLTLAAILQQLGVLSEEEARPWTQQTRTNAHSKAVGKMYVRLLNNG